MKFRTFIALLFAIVFFSSSCEKQENTRKEDEKELAKLYGDIKALSESVSCNDASLWKFTALGAKACGGPTSYIAYSSKIDTTYFLKLVNTYTEKMQVFNVKYGVISDCSVMVPPDGIICKEDKPQFVYNDRFEPN